MARVGPSDGDRRHPPRARQRKLPSLRQVLLQPGVPGPHPQAAQAGEPKVRRSFEGVGEQLRVPVAGHALLPHVADAEDHEAAPAHGRNPPKAAQRISRATCLCGGHEPPQQSCSGKYFSSIRFQSIFSFYFDFLFHVDSF